ncbi:MAG: hypothetical protein GY782_08525 [Gammaproteobacteria bacterium]|nr:hypothetical protein [Gammaproteobacteria bacterium]
MKILHITFSKASIAWRCEIEYRVSTQRQCTMETHVTEGSGYNQWFGLLGILTAFLDAYIGAKSNCKYLQAIKGEWNIEEVDRVWK